MGLGGTALLASHLQPLPLHTKGRPAPAGPREVLSPQTGRGRHGSTSSPSQGVLLSEVFEVSIPLSHRFLHCRMVESQNGMGWK